MNLWLHTDCKWVPLRQFCSRLVSRYFIFSPQYSREAKTVCFGPSLRKASQRVSPRSWPHRQHTWTGRPLVHPQEVHFYYEMLHFWFNLTVVLRRRRKRWPAILQRARSRSWHQARPATPSSDGTVTSCDLSSPAGILRLNVTPRGQGGVRVGSRQRDRRVNTQHPYWKNGEGRPKEEQGASGP